MELGQNLRRHWREMRARAADAHARAGAAASEHLSRADFIREWRWRNVQGIAIAVAIVVFLVWPLAAWLDSTIDDDPNFAAPAKALTGGRSHTVANEAALIRREVNKNGWTANAPWFWPTALLDDMPNYQTGIITAVGHVTLALSDQAGRTRGTGQSDPDLQTATGLLQYPPDVWVWDPSVSVWPTATSASQYKKAMKALRAYNGRIAARQASFDAGAASLDAILDRAASDLDSTSAAIEDHLEHKSGWPFDTASDDLFYRSKGELYGYYIILKGVQSDFAATIAARGLQKPWADMMQSFRDAIGLEPAVVLNGSPDAAIFACTLCGEGFYVARAQTKTAQIRDLLRQ